MIPISIIRYNFKFSYRDLSGMLWEYPCIIDVLDTPGADREAYRQALISFGNSTILNRNFIAPETLTIKMQKEIVKEVTLDGSEETGVSRY